MVKSGQYASYWNVFLLRESIPVGCIPSTAVAVGGGGGVCPGGDCVSQHALRQTPLPPWTEFLKHACENIVSLKVALPILILLCPQSPFLDPGVGCVVLVIQKDDSQGKEEIDVFEPVGYTSSRQFPSNSVYKQQHIDCFQRNINIRYHVSSTSQ